MKCQVRAPAIGMSLSTAVLCLLPGPLSFPVTLPEPTPAFSPSIFEALGRFEKDILQIQSCCRVY